jgi:hypothetical protein
MHGLYELFIAGIVGRSELWRLYGLYSFDLIRDLVFDGMHSIPLNILKKFIEEFMQLEGCTTGDKEEIEGALKVVENTRLKKLA